MSNFSTVIQYHKEISDSDLATGAEVFDLGGHIERNDNKKITGDKFQVSLIQMSNYIPNIYKNPQTNFNSKQFQFYTDLLGSFTSVLLPVGIYKIEDIQDAINARLDEAGIVDNILDPPFRIIYNETLGGVGIYIYNSKLIAGDSNLRIQLNKDLNWMLGFERSVFIYDDTNTPKNSEFTLKINSQGSIGKIFWSLSDYIYINNIQEQNIAVLPVFSVKNVIIYPDNNVIPNIREFRFNSIDNYQIRIINEYGQTIFFMLGGIDIVISIF